MSEVTSLLFTFGLYKIVCLIVGLLFGWMGYQLFKAGIWGSTGDLEAKYSDTSLVIKQAAPGSFFAVCGVFIVVFTVITGFSWYDEYKHSVGFAPVVSLPDKPPF